MDNLAKAAPDWIPDWVPMDNQFFSGGLGLAAIGLGMTVLRSSTGALQMLARRHLMVTLEVTNKDVSYPWVLQWLNAHGRATQHLSVRTDVVQSINGASSISFDFVPGPGRHLIHYDRRWFFVERQREHQTFAMASGEPWEKVVFTSYGRDVSCFSSLLREARAMSMLEEEGSTVVYTCWGTEWRPFGHPRRKRKLSSVVLDDGIQESILADIEEWRSSASWYHARGIPYRRGYLLHGPPGSGKTSFVTALAGHLDMNICVLSLSEEGLTDDRLALALSVVPLRSIILLEDVDAAFGSRMGESEGIRGSSGSSLTFSGLLNTLDGVASSEERVIFMTTNFIERLDPALMRPGRVDVVQFFDDATHHQAKQLFRNFYPQEFVSQDTTPHTIVTEEPLASVEVTPVTFTATAEVTPVTSSDLDIQFADALRTTMTTPPSMAELQGYLMDYKNDPRGAVTNMSNLHETVKARSELQSRQEKESRRLSAIAGFREERSSRTRGLKGRRLSATDVDRMVFNPQPGWEEACGIKKE